MYISLIDEIEDKMAYGRYTCKYNDIKVRLKVQFATCYDIKVRLKSSVNHVLRYQSFDTKRASSSSFEIVRRSNLNLVLIYRLSLRVGLDSEFLPVFDSRALTSFSFGLRVKSVQALALEDKGFEFRKPVGTSLTIQR